MWTRRIAVVVVLLLGVVVEKLSKAGSVEVSLVMEGWLEVGKVAS